MDQLLHTRDQAGHPEKLEDEAGLFFLGKQLQCDAQFVVTYDLESWRIHVDGGLLPLDSLGVCFASPAFALQDWPAIHVVGVFSLKLHPVSIETFLKKPRPSHYYQNSEKYAPTVVLSPMVAPFEIDLLKMRVAPRILPSTQSPVLDYYFSGDTDFDTQNHNPFHELLLYNLFVLWKNVLLWGHPHNSLDYLRVLHFEHHARDHAPA
mmetsp:Transcript_19856/g.38914  ORF Transcript_19856/g.38914 Transcript_19856/m.38914 type:complete len:207 (-) Transcript_19856:413-1033(-)